MGRLLLLLLLGQLVNVCLSLPQIPREGRVLVVAGEPRDNSPPGRAGFRLPLLEDHDAVVVEVGVHASEVVGILTEFGFLTL